MREEYTRKKRICHNCKDRFEIEEMQADYITPLHLGGKNIFKELKNKNENIKAKKSLNVMW